MVEGFSRCSKLRGVSAWAEFDDNITNDEEEEIPDPGGANAVKNK